MSSPIRKHRRRAQREVNKAIGTKLYLFSGLMSEISEVVADHNKRVEDWTGREGEEPPRKINIMEFLHSCLSDACMQYWKGRQAEKEKEARVQVAPASVLGQIEAEEKKRGVQSRKRGTGN